MIEPTYDYIVHAARLEKNTFHHYDNFWMGAYTDPRELIFYKYADLSGTSKYENEPDGDIGFQIQFRFDKNQRIIKATRFSVLDFLSSAPSFILFLHGLFMPIVKAYSGVSFELNVLSKLFNAKLPRKYRKVTVNDDQSV